MLEIANNTGNRCCKRSTYSMLVLATNYFSQHLGVPLEGSAESWIKCETREQNPLCNGIDCRYYE